MKTLHRHFPKVCFFAAALAITAIVFGQNSATEVQQGIRGITGTHSGQPPVVDFEKEISSPKSAQRMQKMIGLNILVNRS